MARNNRQVVPESRHVLQQWKYEIAAEFGLPVGYGTSIHGVDSEFADELGTVSESTGMSTYWGHLTSRETGSVGGEITKRLIAEAQHNFIR